jgi:hypothetical protein
MLGRLLIGMVKGLVVGGLLGFALVKLGMAVPGAVIAYLAAALTGVVIGLVAGKPIWAKDARIEAGAKAVVGALLGVGLMAAARQWLMVALPIPVGTLGTLVPEGVPLTLGGFAMTSLAAIAALLGGFYDADNDAVEEERPQASDAARAQSAQAQRRIASRPASGRPGDEEEEIEPEADEKRTKK